MLVLRAIIIATLTAAVGAPFQESQAQACAGLRLPKWKLTVENDALVQRLGVNEDRNYTMGLYVTKYGPWATSGFVARSLESIDGLRLLSPDEQPVCSYEQIDYGISAFTPDEIERSAPIQGDRPYASVLYVSSFKTRVFEQYALRSRIVYGALGLDVAKAAQKFLHNDLGASDQDPLGWNNQISEGGEPTAMYAIERVRKVFGNDGIVVLTEGDSQEPSPPARGSVELTYKYGMNVGYYTNGFVGATLRVGRIFSPYHSFDADPAGFQSHAPVSFLQNVGASEIEGARDSFGFFGLVARAVAYNVLLQGQFRSSAVEFRSSQVERIVYDASAGYTHQLRSRSVITVALQYRSAEYEGSFSRAHSFAGVYFSRALRR